MNSKIIDEPLRLTIHGFGGMAINRDYAVTAFKLMDKMWQIVKSAGLKNKGLNVWVYEPEQMMFAGVELSEATNQETGLEKKEINLPRYASFIHRGPYHQIRQSVQQMTEELTSAGVETVLPYIEIYGHWTNDEAKLETELLMCLKS